MKAILALRTAALVLCLLFTNSCASWQNYAGPTIRFSAGFEGVDIGVSIIGKRGMSQAELVQAIQKTGFFETQPETLRTK